MRPDALTSPSDLSHPSPRSQDWRSVEDVAWEMIDLYSNRNGRRHVADLHQEVEDVVVRAAGVWKSQGRWEAAAQLLALVPLPHERIQPGYARLRMEVALYEFRRVARVRRRLLLAIAAVLLYLFAVSPTLFVRLENPARLANHMSVLDWSEGLYWSVITAMTVGYGDIAPQTPYARLLSLWNATLGVTLMAVIAGLILGLVTPRRMN
jgi:Ion channel